MKLKINRNGQVIEQREVTEEEMATALDKYDEEIIKSTTLVLEENTKIKDISDVDPREIIIELK